MSYEEKGQWVYLVVNVLTFVGYVVVIRAQARTMPVTDLDYVPLLLAAIGIGIALSIVGRILVEIA